MLAGESTWVDRIDPHCTARRWQVTNKGIVHLAIAARRLRTLRLFGTSASAGLVRDRFARPPAQTVTVDKHAWWLQRPSAEAVAVN